MPAILSQIAVEWVTKSLGILEERGSQKGVLKRGVPEGAYEAELKVTDLR